jgi:hypothetical protein
VIEAPSAAVGVAELEAWVREHRVTWETRLRRDSVQDPDEPAELELTLLGRYPGGQLPSGCDGCELVYERLRSIALHVLALVPGASYRFDPFDAAVRLRPEHDWTPEVELTVGVEVPAGDSPDAGSQRRTLAPIESGLERLGVQRKHWHSEGVP